MESAPPAADTWRVRTVAPIAGRVLVTVGVVSLSVLTWTGTAVADDSRFEIVASDQKLTKSIVFAHPDFDSRVRQYWIGGPARVPGTLPGYSACATSKRDELVVTGFAGSDFTYQAEDGSTGFELATASSAFRTPEMVARGWQATYERPGAVACARAEFARAFRQEGRIVAFRRMAFPNTGDRTIAYRWKLRYFSGGDVLSDWILFRRGRAICVVETVTGAGPAAPRLLDHWDKWTVELLDGRLAAAFG
jgi:hypothetical protein